MTISINLLPWREEQKEVEKRKFFSLIGLSSLLAVTVVFGTHVLFVHQINIQMDLNRYLSSEIKILDEKIAEIDNIQKEKERLLARMDIIQQLQSNRPHVVRLFDNIVRTVPEGLYLLSLTRQGVQIALEGKAESNTRVSKFMRNIESSDWLEKPQLNVIEADSKSPDSIITFTLNAEQVKKDY